LCLLLGDLTTFSENDADCSVDTSGDGDDDGDDDGDGGGDGANGRAGRSRTSMKAPFSGLLVGDSEIRSLKLPEGGVPVGELEEPSIAVQNPP